MRSFVILLTGLLAGLLPLCLSARDAVRDQAVTPAPNLLAAELDARARATRIWDSSAEAIIDAPLADDPPAVPLAGFLGPREGDLDPTIDVHAGEPGVRRVLMSYGDRPPVARAVAIGQTRSGSLLFAGQVGGPTPSQPTRIGIVQLFPTGGLDPALNTSGMQTFDLSNPALEVIGGFVLSEDLHSIFWDRIYLLARDFELASGETFALICFRREFAANTFEPCPDFGVGVRYYNLGLAGTCPSDDSRPGGIYLDRRNPPRIFMVGQTRRTFNTCADFDWAILKVQMDGVLDTGFGGTGQVAYWVPDGQSVDRAMARTAAIRLSGPTLVVGGSTGEGVNERAILAQFQENGTIDADFCATSVGSCDSPAGHRNGRRSWETLATGRVTALAATLGDGMYVARRSGAESASETFGLLSRIDGGGGCSALCNTLTMFPASGTRFTPVAVHWAFRQDISPPGFRISVAGWARPSASSDEGGTAYVYRFRDAAGSLVTDDDFVSRGSIPWRQDITWPPLGTTPRDAEVFGMGVDRQGRILLAAGVRAFGSERDMGIARLQGKVVLFRNGFD
jgi:hypothetical protein